MSTTIIDIHNYEYGDRVYFKRHDFDWKLNYVLSQIVKYTHPEALTIVFWQRKSDWGGRGAEVGNLSSVEKLPVMVFTMNNSSTRNVESIFGWSGTKLK